MRYFGIFDGYFRQAEVELQKSDELELQRNKSSSAVRSPPSTVLSAPNLTSTVLDFQTSILGLF